MIAYLGAVRPFEKQYQNYLEIFNEICILGAAYHLLTLTNYMDDFDMQYNTGWSLITITALNMIVNIGFMMVFTIKELFGNVSKLLQKYKAWREKSKKLKAEIDAVPSASFYFDNGPFNSNP